MVGMDRINCFINLFNLTIQTFYTKHRRLIIVIVCLLALAVLLWFIFRRIKVLEGHAKEIKALEERNKYLESENYKDSVARFSEYAKIDTVNKIITLTNERIIYNTKIYEKIIHRYDSANASEHEKYYRARYSQDTSAYQR
jgi:hypothetical protein